MTKALLVILTTLSITACGGGGSSSDTGQATTVERIAGIWQGTGNDVGEVGIVTENGDLFFIDIAGNTLTTGRVTSASGNKTFGTLSTYAVVGSVFPDGSTVLTSTFDATVKSSETLLGTTTSKFGSTSFSYAYDTGYDLPSSLSSTAGTWSGIDAFGDSVTLAINSSGVISGSDSSGCTYGGQNSIINSN